MRLRATWQPYRLVFKRPSRTSRAVMTDKLTYFVAVEDVDSGRRGIGEVALFQGLSADDTPDFERLLDETCQKVNGLNISDIPSSAIRFGFETAFADLRARGDMQPFGPRDMAWSHTINGLVWMADKETMLAQAREKIEAGFKCVKLKIGGIDFEQELEILAAIRDAYSADILQLRLDANGAFSPRTALSKLERLAAFDIHSIEQPLMAGQPDEMAKICSRSPIPIALDEELIGLTSDADKKIMLERIRPRYIILKPSLCGGFAQADSWIETAERLGIGWWATSALESDIGLNAIARWLYSRGQTLSLPQGLGTGQLYVNNFPSPMTLEGATLRADYEKQWDLSLLEP